MTTPSEVEMLLNYREIFDAANDAICLHDATTGAILDVNQTALDMFGYSREELQKLPGDQLCLSATFTYQEAVRRLRQAATDFQRGQRCDLSA